MNFSTSDKVPEPSRFVSHKYSFSQSYNHVLLSTSKFWEGGNISLVHALGQLSENKILVLLEASLQTIGFDFLQEKLQEKAQIEGLDLVSQPIWMEGTETCKDDWIGVNAVCEAINQYHIDRHATVIAVGGGAFLDMVGFACSIAHRGVNLIRVPTTLLAQADSGVGVKSAINAFGKKNFLGAFGVPLAVINDDAFLATLNTDLILAGLSEAIKVALIKDPSFFSYLEEGAFAAITGSIEYLRTITAQSAKLHIEHICLGKDPFEKGSSRPLDFGHWSAHKAESVSGFTYPHGLAVGAGLHLDCLYSYKMGWLPETAYQRIKLLLLKVGYNLAPVCFLEKENGVSALVAGIEEFREHLGGKLTLLMLKEIGQPIEIHEVNLEILNECISSLESIQGRGIFEV